MATAPNHTMQFSGWPFRKWQFSGQSTLPLPKEPYTGMACICKNKCTCELLQIRDSNIRLQMCSKKTHTDQVKDKLKMFNFIGNAERKVTVIESGRSRTVTLISKHCKKLFLSIIVKFVCPFSQVDWRLHCLQLYQSPSMLEFLVLNISPCCFQVFSPLLPKERYTESLSACGVHKRQQQ